MLHRYVNWKQVKWPLFAAFYVVYLQALPVAVFMTGPGFEGSRCKFMEATSPSWVTLPEHCPPRT